MRTWIKTSLTAAMAAAIGLGATVAVAGTWGDCGGPEGGRHSMQRGMDPAAMQERAADRLDRLGKALSLQPEQTSAWEAFKTAMLTRTQTAAERMKEMREQARPATAPERLARMETFGKERLAAMGETRRAVDTLYAQLTDAQKKTFDEQFRMVGAGGDGRHGKGRGHHMGPHGMS